MACKKCDALVEENKSYPECTSESHALNVEHAEMVIKGQSVGFVLEGPPPDDPEGRRVDYKPASGGQSVSRTDSGGAFEVDLSGTLEPGRQGEWHVLKILANALQSKGHSVRLLSGARDDHGQDGMLCIDDRPVEVQIVSMPAAPQLWRELAVAGAASQSGNQHAAVGLVRSALEHKANSAAGTLLALDASHFGAMVTPHLVDAYRDMYGNPAEEFSLVDVWIIGPTALSSVRFTGA